MGRDETVSAVVAESHCRNESLLWLRLSCSSVRVQLLVRVRLPSVVNSLSTTIISVS